jgi:hypothetical protein
MPQQTWRSAAWPACGLLNVCGGGATPRAFQRAFCNIGPMVMMHRYLTFGSLNAAGAAVLLYRADVEVKS